MITGLDVNKNPIVVVNDHDIYILDEFEKPGCSIIEHHVNSVF